MLPPPLPARGGGGEPPPHTGRDDRSPVVTSTVSRLAPLLLAREERRPLLLHLLRRVFFEKAREKSREEPIFPGKGRHPAFRRVRALLISHNPVSGSPMSSEADPTGRGRNPQFTVYQFSCHPPGSRPHSIRQKVIPTEMRSTEFICHLCGEAGNESLPRCNSHAPRLLPAPLPQIVPNRSLSTMPCRLFSKGI